MKQVTSQKKNLLAMRLELQMRSDLIPITIKDSVGLLGIFLKILVKFSKTWLGFSQASPSIPGETSPTNKKYPKGIFLLVGLLGIEPRSYAPHAQIIPLYDSPKITPKKTLKPYLDKALMHFAQAITLLPANSTYFFLLVSTGTVNHCKLGYFLFFGLGLYLEINFLNCLPIKEDLPQIEHSFSIYNA